MDKPTRRDRAGTGAGEVFCPSWRHAPILVAALAGLALMFSGCQDEVSRYHTLSFFFDGVPPPEGVELPPQPEKLIGPWGIQVDPDSELGQQMVSRRQVRRAVDAEPEPQYFYHTPYKQRNCFGCHQKDQGYQPPELGKDLCRKCHGAYLEYQPDDKVHGPVVVGQCGVCHEAHKSEQPGLLRADQPALCFRCHDESFIDDDPFHALMQAPRCSDCHDPHAAGNRLLLADSRTYKRRSGTMQLLPSPHASWPKDLCRQCHVPERSNQLTDEVDSTCRTCHSRFDPKQPEDPNLHGAIKQARCTACHTPHRSSRPKLIRPDAEDLCFTCHKLDELRTASHPDVTRVDCLLCHAGHSSDRPYLLRPNISMAPGRADPSPGPEMAAPAPAGAPSEGAP